MPSALPQSCCERYTGRCQPSEQTVREAHCYSRVNPGQKSSSAEQTQFQFGRLCANAASTRKATSTQQYQQERLRSHASLCAAPHKIRYSCLPRAPKRASLRIWQSLALPKHARSRKCKCDSKHEEIRRDEYPTFDEQLERALYKSHCSRSRASNPRRPHHPTSTKSGCPGEAA